MAPIVVMMINGHRQATLVEDDAVTNGLLAGAACSRTESFTSPTTSARECNPIDSV